MSSPLFSVLDFCIALLWLYASSVFFSLQNPVCRSTSSVYLGKLPCHSLLPRGRHSALYMDCCSLTVVTVLTLLMNNRYLGYFVAFNLFFVLLVLLHCILRNDSVKSRFSVSLNEKRKELMRNWLFLLQTEYCSRRSCWHFQHLSIFLKLGAPHYDRFKSRSTTEPHFQSRSVRSMSSCVSVFSADFSVFPSDFGFSSSRVRRLSLLSSREKHIPIERGIVRDNRNTAHTLVDIHMDANVSFTQRHGISFRIDQWRNRSHKCILVEGVVVPTLYREEPLHSNTHRIAPISPLRNRRIQTRSCLSARKRHPPDGHNKCAE